MTGDRKSQLCGAGRTAVHDKKKSCSPNAQLYGMTGIIMYRRTATHLDNSLDFLIVKMRVDLLCQFNGVFLVEHVCLSVHLARPYLPQPTQQLIVKDQRKRSDENKINC